MKQRVAAPLALQHQREGGIAADVDPGDVVHLEGDFQRHRLRLSRTPGRPLFTWRPRPSAIGDHQLRPSASKAERIWRGRRPGTETTTSKRWSNPAAAGLRASQSAAARGDAAAGGDRDRLQRGGLVGPALHLDEGDEPAAAGDEVDLAGRACGSGGRGCGSPSGGGARRRASRPGGRSRSAAARLSLMALRPSAGERAGVELAARQAGDGGGLGRGGADRHRHPGDRRGSYRHRRRWSRRFAGGPTRTTISPFGAGSAGVRRGEFGERTATHRLEPLGQFAGDGRLAIGAQAPRPWRQARRRGASAIRRR